MTNEILKSISLKYVEKSVNRSLYLKKIQKLLPFETRRDLYKAFILPHFNNCSITWHYCNKKSADKLEMVKKNINRIIFLPHFFKLPSNYHFGKLWISYQRQVLKLNCIFLWQVLFICLYIFFLGCRWISSYSENKINSSRHLVALSRSYLSYNGIWDV